VVWRWPDAALGAAYALPGALLVFNDLTRGLALALGVLPGAIVGLMPRRRGRLAIIVLGCAIGVPLFVGGIVAGAPILAVAAIAVLGPASARLAARHRLGQVAMSLSLPMFGVGLSYPGVQKGAEVCGLMIAGSIYACLVSMLWPERAAAPRAAPDAGARGPALEYGVRLGAAGATAAAIGFLLDLEHVGWACAAALLVMRPAAEMQRLRSVGRIISVAVGALAAILLVRLHPPAAIYALVVLATVAGAAATHTSRWYVTPAFTTFLVFLLLLYARPQDAASRFDERVLETLLGVAIAYLFGLALPAPRWPRSRARSPADGSASRPGRARSARRRRGGSASRR